MTTVEKINDIINNRDNNIAFLFGNGIHYQFKDCNMPWDDLIKKLWKKHVDKINSLPSDMTLTEIYDIIEMKTIEASLIDEYNRNLESLKELPKNSIFKELSAKVTSEHIQAIAKAAPSIKNYRIDSNLIANFLEEHQKLVTVCREWCESNIEESVCLNNNDCISYMIDLMCNPTKRQIQKNLVKKEVCKEFQPKDKYYLTSFISKIQHLNAPILTTNFDTYISDSIGAKLHKNIQGSDPYKFSDFYPWNVYYSSQELDNILDNFGVWHINGTIDYPRSIRLGLSDYMGCVEKARKMIHGNNLNEYFNGKTQDYWKGYNTWLHILFNKNIFICGLNLDINEVFLRWLLIQRAKYKRQYKGKLRGWYVNKGIPDGKKFFLEFLGFEVIDVTDFDEFYNAFN